MEKSIDWDELEVGVNPLSDDCFGGRSRNRVGSGGDESTAGIRSGVAASRSRKRDGDAISPSEIPKGPLTGKRQIGVSCSHSWERPKESLSTADVASARNNSNRSASFGVRGGGMEGEEDEDEGYEEEDEDECGANGGGTGSGTNNNSQHRHVSNLTEQAIEQFYDAMSLINPAERDGWERAKENCPASVLTHECCPCFFLVACQMNPWNAAARMCAYWRERIVLFEDRAFQPITMGSDVVDPTGFTKEDVEVLMTGSASMLPTDKSGAAIIFCEETRLEPHMFELWKSRARVLFYLFHAGYSRFDGPACNFVSIYGCDKVPANGQFSSATWHYAAASSRIWKVMPICWVSTYLLTRPSRSGTGLLIQVMLYFVKAVLGKFSFNGIQVVHGTVAQPTGDAEKDDVEARVSLLHQLRSFGFTQKQLPDWAGGQFALAEFRAWIRRRRRLEQKLFWTAEQHALQVRGRNRIKSQKRRQRRRQDLLGLQSQVQQLLVANARAKSDEKELLSLLREAREKVKAMHRFDAPTPNMIPALQPAASATLSYSHFRATSALPDLVQGDLLTPSMLALLEPDPIAPSCMPGRAGQEVARRGLSFEGTFLPSIRGSAENRYRMLSSMTTRTDDQTLAAYDGCNPLSSALTAVSTSSQTAVSTTSHSCSMLQPFADELASLESESMRAPEIALDLDQTLLDTLLRLEGKQANVLCLSRSCDASDLGPIPSSSGLLRNEHESSHSLPLIAEDCSSPFAHCETVVPASVVRDPSVSFCSQDETQFPTAFPIACRQIPYRPAQPTGYGVAQGSHDQHHQSSISPTTPDEDTMPELFYGDSLPLHSDRQLSKNSEAFAEHDMPLHSLFNYFN